MKALNYFFLGTLLMLSCACQKKKAPDRNPISFDDSYSIKAHYDQDESALKVNISLKEGFHAYGPQETIGKPVRLLIEASNGYKALGEPSIPMGVKKNLPGLGDSYVLDNSFSIVQPVSKGQGAGHAILYLQVCTDIQCDKPRAHDLSF